MAKFADENQKQDLESTSYPAPYFGGLKDSPTCRHNLQVVTYPYSKVCYISLQKINKDSFWKSEKTNSIAITYYPSNHVKIMLQML